VITFGLFLFDYSIHRTGGHTSQILTRFFLQCISTIALVKNENEVLDSPVWIILINVVALEMLKAKMPRFPGQCLPHHRVLQRHNTENLKQIFSEKELRGLSPNFHNHVPVSDLYIPTISLPILLQENMWTDPWNTVYKSLTDT
jgi:hypothetical protein